MRVPDLVVPHSEHVLWAGVLVEVDTLCEVVNTHVSDIDPDDPTNIEVVAAFDCSHAAPQRTWSKDLAR